MEKDQVFNVFRFFFFVFVSIRVLNLNVLGKKLRQFIVLSFLFQDRICEAEREEESAINLKGGEEYIFKISGNFEGIRRRVITPSYII
jgi:hypothetical protein